MKGSRNIVVTRVGALAGTMIPSVPSPATAANEKLWWKNLFSPGSPQDPRLPKRTDQERKTQTSSSNVSSQSNKIQCFCRCDDCFQIVGAASITCQQTGQWSALSAPVCEREESLKFAPSEPRSHLLDNSRSLLCARFSGVVPKPRICCQLRAPGVVAVHVRVPRRVHL